MSFRDRIRGITRPDPSALLVPPEELRARLLGLNQAALAWHVREATSDRPERRADLVVEWKIADPYWHSIFERVGVNETFTTRLRFHPDTVEVRSKDRCYGESTTTDSDGATSTGMVWQTGQMHEVAAGTVDGQHLTFDTEDFKKVVKRTVIDAGWRYRTIVLRRL